VTVDGRTAARVFTIILGIAAVGITIVGFRVTAGVRRTAVETDRSLRSLAWAMLAYSEVHGAFPAGEEFLVAFGPGGNGLAGEPPGEWPRTRADALADLDAKPLPDALREIRVLWTASGAAAPYLAPDGLPSGVGTIDLVNRWLDARGKAGFGPAPGGESATIPAPETDRP
jgi:hypothetical protein